MADYRKIKFRPWGASRESGQEGFLIAETEAKFIVTTRNGAGIEMHFPKSMYQFEYIDE